MDNLKHKLIAKLYKVEYKNGDHQKVRLIREQNEEFLNVYNAYRRRHDYEFEKNLDLEELKEQKRWFVDIITIKEQRRAQA